MPLHLQMIRKPRMKRELAVKRGRLQGARKKNEGKRSKVFIYGAHIEYIKFTVHNTSTHN